MPKRFTDEEFIDAWMRYGSPRKVADALSLPVRSVHQRRRSIEARHGIALPSKVAPTCKTGIKAEAGQAANRLAEQRARRYESEMHLELHDGVVMIASDCHYWPGVVTPAHEAFCKLAKALKPDIVVLNGDILDGAPAGAAEPRQERYARAAATKSSGRGIVTRWPPPSRQPSAALAENYARSQDPSCLPWK